MATEIYLEYTIAEDVSMEILAKELVPSRTDKFLDSVAVCCGAVEGDNGEFDEFRDELKEDYAEFHDVEKFWRVPTAATCETQTLDESVANQPSDEEETIPSLDSISTSIPRIIRVEVEEEEEVQSEIRSQIFVHTIRRDKNEEEEDKTKVASVASKMKLHAIQENVATVGHKMKSVWIPVAKSKLEQTNADLKRHLSEWRVVAVVSQQKVKALWLQKKSVWIPLVKTHVTNVRQNTRTAIMEQKALWIPAIKSNMDKLRIVSVSNMDKLRIVSVSNMDKLRIASVSNMEKLRLASMKNMQKLRVASVSHRTKFLLMQKKSLKKMQKMALKYNLIAGQRIKRLPRPSIMAAMAQLKAAKKAGNKGPVGMEIEISNSEGFEVDLSTLPIRTVEMESC